MALAMIVVGVSCLLFGTIVLAWATRTTDRMGKAFRYHGVMFMGMGGGFVLGNSFPAGGPLYAVLIALCAVVFWSGWMHVSTLRRLSQAQERGSGHV